MLVLECATEARAFPQAFDAWWELAGYGWQHPNRGWLGRRLGTAAAGAVPSTTLKALASSLEPHARCLTYWAAQHDPEGEQALQQLAMTTISDVYGQWAREELGVPPPQHVTLAPPVLASAPPQSVAWLIEWKQETLASQHWAQLRRTRGVSAAEALAAARFETERGRIDLAIRCLLQAHPELSSPSLAQAPEDVVHAYLPLRFRTELTQASCTAGIEPWLLAGLARQESLFITTARSPAGAVGMLQLIPSTARKHLRTLRRRSPLDLTDPLLNLGLGAREVAALLTRFGALEPALAAYNAGETRARRWWRQWPEKRRFTEAIPIPETYTYVRRVSFLAEAYRLVYRDSWRDCHDL